MVGAARPPAVTMLEVAAARDYMRMGFSMKQAAEKLNLLSGDLDLALWRWIGADIPVLDAPSRPPPMF